MFTPGWVIAVREGGTVKTWVSNIISLFVPMFNRARVEVSSKKEQLIVTGSSEVVSTFSSMHAVD